MREERRMTRQEHELVDGSHLRVVIESVSPEIEGGRFAIKRTIGESVEVFADVHCDGHDAIAAVLAHRRSGQVTWLEVAMEPVGNDRFRATFPLDRLIPHEYTVIAWVDAFSTWLRGLGKKVDAGQEVRVDLLVGAALVEGAAGRAGGADAKALTAYAKRLRDGLQAAAVETPLAELMSRYPDRHVEARYEKILRVTVERERARFGSWYELFPRSSSDDPGRHGTLADCAKRLRYVADMGFDVVYLPPIHPIGRTHRKGRNNSVTAGPDEPGSPWAIGAAEGGHTAIHPQLGTLQDFDALMARAKEAGLEIAMDLAFQCAPDHPWVGEHPEWFQLRPDGTIQYAENPPKKYQDIYPFDFDIEDRQGLWDALLGVVTFWTARGVRIFRVDNPHTKPYPLWEWLIRETRARHPEVIFLSEAFTRPKVMYRLAKLGFSQSYTYFTWRNTAAELRDYMTELTRTQVAEFFRPNLWPNTPDILPEFLQAGGRPAFAIRAVLAGTLGASYGIYGPAFELCEDRPLQPGREDYLDSEKYEIRTWDLDRPDSLRPVLTRLNAIRRQHPALQSNVGLTFHPVSNDRILAYSKRAPDGTNAILTVVNLDPHHTQSGWVEIPLDALGLAAEGTYQMHDLLGGGRFLWQGARNLVELDPRVMPAHVFAVRRRLRTERDFDYYL